MMQEIHKQMRKQVNKIQQSGIDYKAISKALGLQWIRLAWLSTKDEIGELSEECSGNHN